MRQTGLPAVCPVCFVPGGVRAACKTKSRFAGRDSPRYENYRTKVGKKALAATFLRSSDINNLMPTFWAGVAAPIRCRVGFSCRRMDSGVVCCPCPAGPFLPGKVRINSSLLFYSRLILNFCPYSLGQKADKFAFVPGLFVALHKIGCDSAIFACNPARLLSPFPVFDIALDGMRREKTANKFPFSPGFHYLCTLWKR